MRDERKNLTAQADDGCGEIVDGDLEGQHDGAIGAQPDERRRPTGHARATARSFPRPDRRL